MDAFKTVVADFEQLEGCNFEQVAGRASELGMTHVQITRDLPPAKWQDDYD